MPEPTRPSPVRAVGLTLAIGLGLGVALAAMFYGVLSIPMYFAAAARGLPVSELEWARRVMLVGVPVCIGLGLLCGTFVGVWYARGGRLPVARLRSYSDVPQ